VVGGTGDLPDALGAQCGPVHPAGRLAEPASDRGRLALDEIDLTRRGLRHRRAQATARLLGISDTPLRPPRLEVERRAVEVGEELADVDPDSAGPDDGHPVARDL